MDNKKLEAAARQHSSKWLLREDYGKLDLKWLADESSLCHEFIDKMKVDFAQQLLSEQTAELQKEVERLNVKLDEQTNETRKRSIQPRYDKDGNVVEDPCQHNQYCADFCQGSCQTDYYEALPASEWIEQAVKERERIKEMFSCRKCKDTKVKDNGDYCADCES